MQGCFAFFVFSLWVGLMMSLLPAGMVSSRAGMPDLQRLVEWARNVISSFLQQFSACLHEMLMNVSHMTEQWDISFLCYFWQVLTLWSLGLNVMVTRHLEQTLPPPPLDLCAGCSSPLRDVLHLWFEMGSVSLWCPGIPSSSTMPLCPRTGKSLAPAKKDLNFNLRPIQALIISCKWVALKPDSI